MPGRPPALRPGALAEWLQDRADPQDTPPLRALWLGLRREWALAHEVVQAEGGATDAAWVRPWLHRVEGDAPHATYWYRRTGKAAAEGEAIARTLLARGTRRRNAPRSPNSA